MFSEIGCDGLDYQFCDCIVNYDLPWNPMRVEQRIGRIDRVGQTSESVAIVNLVTPGTIDADIYVRCLVRIGVFERALGGSEEILGEITREIRNIAENYSLSEEDRRDKLQLLPVTFESVCAMQHPKAAFVTPLHPLVKQAAMSLDAKHRVITTLKVKTHEVPAGGYEFAIYQWRIHGIKDDLVLKPIASSEAVTP